MSGINKEGRFLIGEGIADTVECTAFSGGDFSFNAVLESGCVIPQGNVFRNALLLKVRNLVVSYKRLYEYIPVFLSTTCSADVCL